MDCSNNMLYLFPIFVDIFVHGRVIQSRGRSIQYISPFVISDIITSLPTNMTKIQTDVKYNDYTITTKTTTDDEVTQGDITYKRTYITIDISFKNGFGRMLRIYLVTPQPPTDYVNYMVVSMVDNNGVVSNIMSICCPITDTPEHDCYINFNSDPYVRPSVLGYCIVLWMVACNVKYIQMDAFPVFRQDIPQDIYPPVRPDCIMDKYVCAYIWLLAIVNSKYCDDTLAKWALYTNNEYMSFLCLGWIFQKCQEMLAESHGLMWHTLTINHHRTSLKTGGIVCKKKHICGQVIEIKSSLKSDHNLSSYLNSVTYNSDSISKLPNIPPVDNIYPFLISSAILAFLNSTNGSEILSERICSEMYRISSNVNVRFKISFYDGADLNYVTTRNLSTPTNWIPYQMNPIPTKNKSVLCSEEHNSICVIDNRKQMNRTFKQNFIDDFTKRDIPDIAEPDDVYINLKTGVDMYGLDHMEPIYIGSKKSVENREKNKRVLGGKPNKYKRAYTRRKSRRRNNKQRRTLRRYVR